jgi:hypothetical protein
MGNMAEFFSFGNPTSSLENDYVLVQFGIDEIDKIIFLQETVANYAGDSILVDKAVFTKHDLRLPQDNVLLMVSQGQECPFE